MTTVACLPEAKMLYDGRRVGFLDCIVIIIAIIIIIIIIIIINIAILPVSYTHLDVYKRQIMDALNDLSPKFLRHWIL